MSNHQILNLPKHRNPQPGRTASAPYNFVPLPEVMVTAVDDANDLPDHDRYYPDRHTGYFEVTLTTKSPLYVRCPFTLSEFLRQERREDEGAPFRQQVKNTPDFFYTRNPNQPVIPGSSLRGMLRSLLEIVSYGKVERVTDSFKVTYRAVAAPKDDPLSEPYKQVVRNVRAGYLVHQSDGWYIRPAKKPSDLKLPYRDAYLKVKERQIPDNAIPGFLPLNSDNYRPQYHKVTFAAEVRKGKRGTYIAITKIGTVQAGYPNRGVLVCSGNMLETGGDDTESPRKNHALVLEPDSKAALVRISDQVISDYLDTLTPFQKEPPFDPQMGCLVDGRPVFYVERAGQVLFFGHCPNFRIPAWRANEKRAAAPLDFVPPQWRRPEDVDYADALFGFVRTGEELKDMKQRGVIQDIPKQGDPNRAYASRAFVTDATLNEGQTDIWFPDDPVITPKILATPKPTAFQHYLVQSRDNKDTLKHYGSPTPQETVIRGHKRYWHQGLGTAERRSLDEIRAMIEEERDRLLQLSEHDTQHTQFKPIKPEVTFTFRVYFENLSDRELGALCWTLHPLGDPQKEYCHHLGMGKPLGMGAVKLEATLHLTDRPTRYASLFDGDKWQTGTTGSGESLSDRPTLERRTREFEQHVLTTLNLNTACQHLFELKRIGMLLKMMEWPGYQADPNGDCFLTAQNRPNTRYMTIQPNNEYRDRPVLPDPCAFDPSICNLAEPTPSSTGASGAVLTTRQLVSPKSPKSKAERARVTTKKEWVTLTEDVKGGKAKVQTEEGQIIICTKFPPYPQGTLGTRCRADVTRQDGRARRAIFKGWK